MVFGIINKCFIDKKGEHKMKKIKKLIVIFLMLFIFCFLLAGCDSSSSSGRRTCGYCGGAGYVRNGATNATEYAFMKKVCPRCGGSGYVD